MSKLNMIKSKLTALGLLLCLALGAVAQSDDKAGSHQPPRPKKTCSLRIRVVTIETSGQEIPVPDAKVYVTELKENGDEKDWKEPLPAGKGGTLCLLEVPQGRFRVQVTATGYDLTGKIFEQKDGPQSFTFNLEKLKH